MKSGTKRNTRIAELVAAIRSELEKYGEGSRQAHRPSAQIDFGVYTKDIRRVIRAYGKQLEADSGGFVLEVSNALIDEKVAECRQVGYELVAGHREAREALDESSIATLARDLDNWACVDNFCCRVAGPAWREGLIGDSFIESWARSEDLWLRRSAVVCTVALNNRARGGRGDAERTIEICRLLVSDSEIMVQKAISWALRQLIFWDRKAVERFLEKYSEQVAAIVKREVTKMLVTGKKTS